MKKINLVFLCSVLVSSMILPINAFADGPIKVYMDSKELNFEVQPIIQDGTTLVPFRTVFEQLGLQVTWFPETKTVVGSKEGLNIELKIGDNNALVNGKPAILEVPPNIISGSTLVPLRFIFESADGEVNWDNKNKTISIYISPEEKLKHAIFNNDVNKIKELLKKKANPNYKDNLYRTPLEWAIPTQFPEVTQALVDGGADINQKDQLGQTPLHLAVLYARPEIVKILVDAKADLNIKNSYGQTPLQSAISSYKIVVDSYKPKLKEIISILAQ